jgi:hypothetical protein
VARRRVLSADGKWFAFATDTYLYVARLDSQPLLAGYQSQPLGAAVELAFSSDGRYLLEQRGTGLWLHDLERPGIAPGAVSDALGEPASCQEQFAENPDTWCGNADNGRQFIWSPNPQVAALRTAVGTLQVLKVEPTGPDVVAINEQCGGICMGQFGFQP